MSLWEPNSLRLCVKTWWLRQPLWTKYKWSGWSVPWRPLFSSQDDWLLCWKLIDRLVYWTIDWWIDLLNFWLIEWLIVRVFDHNNDGSISKEELREAMVNFGTRCTEEWAHDEDGSDRDHDDHPDTDRISYWHQSSLFSVTSPQCLLRLTRTMTATSISTSLCWWCFPAPGQPPIN